MPRGTQTGGNATFVRLLGVKADVPTCEFDFQQRNPDSGEYESTGKDRDFSGTLTGLEVVKRTLKINDVDREMKFIRLKIEDGIETFIWDTLVQSNLGRSMMNTFAAVENFGDANIAVIAYKNKKKYGAVLFDLNGERMGWKYPIEELPAPKKVTVNNQDQFDYTEQTMFLAKEFAKTLDLFAQANISSPMPVDPDSITANNMSEPTEQMKENRAYVDERVAAKKDQEAEQRDVPPPTGDDMPFDLGDDDDSLPF